MSRYALLNNNKIMIKNLILTRAFFLHFIQKMNGRRPSSSSSVKSTPEEPLPAVPTTPAPAVVDKKRPEADVPRGPVPSLPRVPQAVSGPPLSPLAAPLAGTASPVDASHDNFAKKRPLDNAKSAKSTSNGSLLHPTTNDPSNGQKSPTPSDSYTNNNRLSSIANGHHHVLGNTAETDSSGLTNKNLPKHRSNNNNSNCSISSSSSTESSTGSNNNNNKGDEVLDGDSRNDDDDNGDRLIVKKSDMRNDIYVPLSSPGTDYWLARNPVADQVFITDVTVNLKTVTIRECKTEKGFFRERDPKSDIY